LNNEDLKNNKNNSVFLDTNKKQFDLLDDLQNENLLEEMWQLKSEVNILKSVIFQHEIEENLSVNVLPL
jgi:hypothetical protein